MSDSPQTEKKSWNKNLANAKKAKNDEFYTQYHDIEKEINAYLDYNPGVFRGKTVLLPCDDPEWSNFTRFFAQNFAKLGLKKLISTSFAKESKEYKNTMQLSLLEINSPKYDKNKTDSRGKIYTLTHDKTGDGKVNFEDFEWEYLQDAGDFRSEEVRKLRDEADIIVTNPPFSLFREFLAWTVDANKQLVIIGHLNAIIYKEIFPLIRDNKLWLGATGNGSDMVFAVPAGSEVAESDKLKAARLGYVGDYTRLGNSCWFTNIDHGRRHESLPLMTMEDNLKYSKHKEIKGKESYDQYDNYDAIEVPFTDSIPSNYDGVMGVPISFMDKYNPEQFEIVGSNRWINQDSEGIYGRGSYVGDKETFKRIFIKHKK